MSRSAPVLRWWDLRAALLLLVGVLAIASRLTATRWTEHLHISYSIAFFGLLVGLALGQSRFRLATVVVYSIVLGGFVVLWQIGGTLGAGVEWSERLWSLLGRLTTSVVQFSRQQPVQDPLLALILFGVLFWLMAEQAGYALTRHADPWQAVLPGGLALLVIHTYDYRPPGPQFNTLLWAASIYFVVSLLLVARLNYLRYKRGWELNRVQFAPEVDTDISQATLVATIALVVLAWAAPLTPNVLPPARDMWAIVSRPWNDVRARFGNVFTSLRATFGVVEDSYSDQLQLGRGNALGDSVVMTIEAPGQPPPGVRYYWRAWTYDRYDSGRWTTTFEQRLTAAPDAFELPLPSYRSRWNGVFSITPTGPIGTLYTPNNPVWLSRPINATVAEDFDGKVDIASVQAAVTVFGGETYRVHSSLSSATVTQLRESGDDYPAWIKSTYLQLPAVSARTRALAEEITAPYDNPYDKADAITRWLRDNIRYADTIEAPPPNQEPIDWFLFDYRNGFCNYYATAQVVMLRSIGIPARMSVGFARGQAEGEADQIGPAFLEARETLTYSVLQRDAHAWPEVYFADYGWVEFEPTVSQAPINRPLGAPLTNDGDEAESTPSPEVRPTEAASEEAASPEGPQLQPTALPWPAVVGGAAAVLLLALGFIGWQLRERFNLPPLPIVMERSMRRLGLRPPAALREWARIAGLPPIEKAYQEVNAALQRLGEPPGPADTPSERVAALRKALPEVATYAYRLLVEYHLAAYSAKTGNAAVAEQAGRFIRNLSWRRFVDMKINGQKYQPAARLSTWRA